VTNQLPRQRLAYLTRRIHSLGERPLYEFFREIEAGAPLHQTLERYSELWVIRDFIRANDGDRLSAPRVLSGGRHDAA
jgi:hypothetical protein